MGIGASFNLAATECDAKNSSEKIMYQSKVPRKYTCNDLADKSFVSYLLSLRAPFSAISRVLFFYLRPSNDSLYGESPVAYSYCMERCSLPQLNLRFTGCCLSVVQYESVNSEISSKFWEQVGGTNGR